MKFNLSKIQFSTIFQDLIRLFVIACGITLLFLFFGFNEFSFTKENIVKIASHVYLNLFILEIFYVIFSKGGNWILKDSGVICSKKAGNAYAFIDAKNSNEAMVFAKKVSCIHEAGHAVMSYLMEMESFTVISSYASSRVSIDLIKPMNAEELKKHTYICYAGAAAEELFFDEFHSGCFGGDDADFEKATRYIKGYIVMTNNQLSKSYLDNCINEKIVSLSKQFYEDAKKLMGRNKEKIELLSNSLSEKGQLSSNEIKKLLISE